MWKTRSIIQEFICLCWQVRTAKNKKRTDAEGLGLTGCVHFCVRPPLIYALDIAQWLLHTHCIKFCHAIVKEIMMHYCNQLQQDQEKICKRSETSTQRAITFRFYEMNVKVCLRRRRNCCNLQRCYKVYDRNIKC